jgi:formylglycine-generating enzyme required for sulfatase activity
MTPLLLLLFFAPPAPEFIPVHNSNVEITKTEITVAQFRAFVEATRHVTDREAMNSPRDWRRPGFPLKDDQPVVYVTVTDACAYCAWINARLPLESEWLAAAQPTGKLDPDAVWYRENSKGVPHPVAKKRPNASGFHDLEGNAWEWTWRTPPSGNDKGTSSMRGGSFMSCPKISPWAESGPLDSVPGRPHSMTDDDIGFRCARTTAYNQNQARP